MGGGKFQISGSKWKFIRTKLTPTFTSGKMKQMFTLVKETSDELIRYLNENSKEKNYTIMETKRILAKFTVDVISTCAFGIKSNCLRDEKSTFGFFSDMIFETTVKRAYEWRAFFFVHWMIKGLGGVFLRKESTEYFRKVFDETMKERESQKIFRNDFVDNLIKLKNEQEEKLKKENGKTFDKDEIFGEEMMMMRKFF